ncbi:phosphotransferase [Streptodolium elevatio]
MDWMTHAFRLPSPAQLDAALPAPVQDRSSPVLAHGDPTVGNFMWSFGEPVLTDWELARPAPRVSAAAHTLAALVTHAPYPLRPRRMEEFLDKVAGAREALDSGLYATYHAYEVARAQWVDILRPNSTGTTAASSTPPRWPCPPSRDQSSESGGVCARPVRPRCPATCTATA